MELFQTDEGKVHIIRIAGAFFLVMLLGSCTLGMLSGYEDIRAVNCAVGAVFGLGYWLALGSKRPVQRSGDLAGPLHATGLILIFLGALGQFYVLWAHHQPHV